MKTRLIAAFVAVVLGAVGTFVLVGYVRGADARALAGTQTVQVLVVSAPIAAGTPAEQLGALIAVNAIPQVAAVPGRVTSLDQLAGQVSLVALVPGEQLLPDKFALPAGLPSAGEVTVPVGFQQVTVQLQSQRVLGGALKAGDTVGIFISMSAPPTTHLTLHRVLVTSVGAPAGPPSADAAAAAPGADVFVTFAVSAADAEKIVFAAQYATIWLSNEGATADQSGTRIVDPGNVYS